MAFLFRKKYCIPETHHLEEKPINTSEADKTNTKYYFITISYGY